MWKREAKSPLEAKSAANSEKIRLDSAANQLKWQLCVAIASIGNRGVVGQERVGTLFPDRFHVLL